jgi:hypothetical protein
MTLAHATHRLAWRLPRPQEDTIMDSSNSRSALDRRRRYAAALALSLTINLGLAGVMSDSVIMPRATVAVLGELPVVRVRGSRQVPQLACAEAVTRRR